MNLTPGSRLGPYEIAGAIGAGGMGEVFRARDTQLGRDVAIKVLPEGFADDPDRRTRFERDARAVAAPSHPNILAIGDTGVDGDRLFVVTDLLEGETLPERLTGERRRSAPIRATRRTQATGVDGYVQENSLSSVFAGGYVERTVYHRRQVVDSPAKPADW